MIYVFSRGEKKEKEKNKESQLSYLKIKHIIFKISLNSSYSGP